KHAVPLLTPRRVAIGPFTTMTGAEPPVVHAVDPTWNCGCSTARTLARTTGKYSGRHPAITAFAATFSTVTVPRNGSIRPRTSSGARLVWLSISATSGSVGGITGSPSVHPSASRYRTASTKSPLIVRRAARPVVGAPVIARRALRPRTPRPPPPSSPPRRRDGSPADAPPPLAG